MKNDRFVIVTRRNSVEVLDFGHSLVEEEGSALLLSFDFEDNEEVARYVTEELSPIVRLLNEQDKELKKVGITLP